MKPSTFNKKKIHIDAARQMKKHFKWWGFFYETFKVSLNFLLLAPPPWKNNCMYSNLNFFLLWTIPNKLGSICM